MENAELGVGWGWSNNRARVRELPRINHMKTSRVLTVFGVPVAIAHPEFV